MPVVTNPGGVMIVGAYPTAKFATVNGVRDVPVADIDAPFSNQTYFDGASVRNVRAGKELETEYLKPLGLIENQLWLTNLVKVFLFKSGHTAKYQKLGNEAEESRRRFREFAENEQAQAIFQEELTIANPSAVILLGEEVTKIICRVGSARAKQMFDGIPRDIEIAGRVQKVFCLPHPGIVMRPGNNWGAHLRQVLPGMRKHLTSMLRQRNKQPRIAINSRDSAGIRKNNCQ